VLEIKVIGTPAPQGSKRHVGRGILIESSAKVKPWREAVVWAARESGGKVPGPVVVDLTFTLQRPKSRPKRDIWPDRKPDLDKLTRSTLDALTTAGAIEDDARVVGLIVWKTYVGCAWEDALDVPGCVIRLKGVE